MLGAPNTSRSSKHLQELRISSEGGSEHLYGTRSSGHHWVTTGCCLLRADGWFRSSAIPVLFVWVLECFPDSFPALAPASHRPAAPHPGGQRGRSRPHPGASPCAAPALRSPWPWDPGLSPCLVGVRGSTGTRSCVWGCHIPPGLTRCCLHVALS